VLLRSADGGASWTTIHPAVSPDVWSSAERLAFSGHGRAVAFPSADQASAFFANHFPQGVLRSADDGRSWRVVRLPHSGIAYGDASWAPGGQTVFVTGVSARKRSGCYDGLWRSTDAGATWQLLPASCGHGGVAVQFLDSSHGFLAGGGDPKFSSGQFVLATNDGGLSWHTVWRNDAQYGESMLVQLDFVDRNHGWAVPGGVTTGANGSYLGDRAGHR
jgi:photosystem II stability/assembly factor-like uncharacterized protein